MILERIIKYGRAISHIGVTEALTDSDDGKRHKTTRTYKDNKADKEEQVRSDTARSTQERRGRLGRALPRAQGLRRRRSKSSRKKHKKRSSRKKSKHKKKSNSNKKKSLKK